MDEDALIAGLPIRDDGLLTATDAAAAGCTSRVRAMHQSGHLVRVWPGIYRRAEHPPQQGPACEARRYRQLVRAAAHQMPGQVFTCYSAAALLGLPIVGSWPPDVYVLAGGPNGSRRPGVRAVGHRWEVPETTVDGIRLTTPAHTIIQLARRASLAAALVAADGALRDLPYTREEPLLTPEELTAEHQRLLPYRGSTRVAAVLRRATTLADQPLESISRLAIEELGFAPPELQHRFWLPVLGEEAWVDFYWPELHIAMEADGAGKYLDAGSALGAAQRVVREKRREDEIRAQVHHFGRWGWDDVWQRRGLEEILVRANVPRLRAQGRLLAA